MSELDKYGKHDPLAQHSSYAKKSKITIADTDAWLKKHGNGMDRLKKNEKTGTANIWSQYGKVSTETLVYRHLNAHGEIVPSCIQDISCRRSVLSQCQKMVKNGELVAFKDNRFIKDANQKHLVNGFKRAWKNPNDSNRLGLGVIDFKPSLNISNV